MSLKPIKADEKKRDQKRLKEKMQRKKKKQLQEPSPVQKKQYEEYDKDSPPSKRCPATRVFELVEELKKYL